MPNSSNVQSLFEKLAEKQAADREQIEALTRSELEKLASDLQKRSSAALSSTLDAIESDLNKRLSGIKKQIEQQTKALGESLASVRAEAETLQALTFRAWLKRLLLSLSLLLGIFAGSSALTAWISHSIQSQLETRAALSRQIDQQRQTIEQQQQAIEQQQQTLEMLEAKTWGVELYQDSNGRFLILPPGASTGWKLGNKQAVRLGKN